METNHRGNRPVKTVETAFELLEYLKEADGATLIEMDENIDLAKSTIHRHLTTLEGLEYVVKEGMHYYPSLRFLDFGDYTRKRKLGYDMAKAKVEELADQTAERAQFLVNEHGKGVFIHRANGSNAVRTFPGIGKSLPLHSTAAGKAILCELPDESVRDLIERRGLVALTPHTITDEDELFDELEETRERGYSINREESVEGLKAIGVSISGPDDDVIGGLSISGPKHRFKGAWFNQELPDLLRGMANEIELNVSHS